MAKTTFVFLNEGYADWELAYILPELVSHKRSVITFGLTSDSVRSLGGLRVTPDLSIDQVNLTDAEALILPGGNFWGSFANPKLERLVHSARSQDLILGAICDATGYLARLGLLDNASHSSNGLDFLREHAPNYTGSSLYSDEPATRDGKLVTADGYGAVDFAGKLTEIYEIYTPELRAQWLCANKVGKWRE